MDELRAFSIRRVTKSGTERVTDRVAAEEPLTIFVKYWQKDAAVTANLAVTMRTPGYEREQAAGLLLSEGIVRANADLVGIHMLGSDAPNEVLVELARSADFDAWRTARNGFVSSSCGVCGKRSIDAMRQDLPAVDSGAFRVAAETVRRLPLLLREKQPAFAETGGLHAAALITSAGGIEAVFEDVGRHNALDKLCGWALLNHRLPLRERIVFMSSRASFELVQKAAMAGASVLATVGGPSSLAVETAHALQMTLVGFVRDERFNVYAGEWRIDS